MRDKKKPKKNPRRATPPMPAGSVQSLPLYNLTLCINKPSRIACFRASTGDAAIFKAKSSYRFVNQNAIEILTNKPEVFVPAKGTLLAAKTRFTGSGNCLW